MVDLLALRLSWAIKRLRFQAELEALNSTLVTTARLAAFETATAEIMHSLGHQLGEFAHRLRKVMDDPTVRSNRSASGFLNYTKLCLGKWIASLGEIRRFGVESPQFVKVTDTRQPFASTRPHRRIGPDALPVLTNIMVRCSAPGIRLEAIDAIAGLGTNGLPAVPVLMACLNDTNGMIDVSAFNALRFLTP